MKFFYNYEFFFIIIWVYVQWLYIFALCLLIWLITTKNHKIVCIMIFYENCLYNGFSYELLVCDGFLYILLFLKLFLVWKRVMWMFERLVKMCEFFGYIVAFKIIF